MKNKTIKEFFKKERERERQILFSELFLSGKEGF